MFGLMFLDLSEEVVILKNYLNFLLSRPVSVQPNKRIKPADLSCGAYRILPSPRIYPKNGPPIP